MENKYLKIDFHDNDLQWAVGLAATAIQQTLFYYSDAIDFENDIIATEKIFNAFKNIILTQLNLHSALDMVNYNYVNEVNSMNFSIVSQDAIEYHNNWETIYFQLFCSKPFSYGAYFFC